jgi:hypothetical protein
MFLSESMIRAIHGDRVREIERSGRERRLVESAAETALAEAEPATNRRPRVAAAEPARPGRTGIPA